MKLLRLAVMGSGKGSNYRAIAQAIADQQLPAEIVLVLADSPDAGILTLARSFGHKAEYFNPGNFRTRMGNEEETQLAQRLKSEEIDYLILAGFMRMVKAPLLRTFPKSIINIHPSLLPAFPGLSAWAQALEAGVKESGCTVHYVDEGMDTGKIILQKRVPVVDGDTPETLHARIQEAEHRAYPQAILQLANEG